VGLYAVLARDPGDFIDMVVDEQDVEALKTLYLILATHNPNIPEWEMKLNTVGADLVRGNLTKRGTPIPQLLTASIDPPQQGRLF